MQNYHVRIRGKLFTRPVLQGGWAQATIGESELTLAGKAMPSIWVQILFGWLSLVLAKPKTVAVPYRDVLDVSLRGNVATLKFKYEDKYQVLAVQPFTEKGFWGGKGPLGQDFVTRLQEKVVA